MAKLYNTDIFTVLVSCLLRKKMIVKQLNYRWLKTLGVNSQFFFFKKSNILTVLHHHSVRIRKTTVSCRNMQTK